jgi:23S rRNA A1618 N6-methylase RlmF
MMTPEQQTRIDEITTRCSLAQDQSVHTMQDRQQLVQDVLWLIQLVEIKDTQIDMLSAPEHVRRLLRDFSNLTQVRKALVLELMREMKEVRQ